GTLGTATLALMMAYDVELEVVGVLRHVTPESWIDVQLSGVSSLRRAFFCLEGGEQSLPTLFCL
ncbi:hypothetical protein, partial [Chromohalobacter japonicus]|uniref:hypothetical protein n=1 Tax=Chromohalobacter japonicus TaxID=223900 RepID=UPI0035E689E5